MYEIIDLMLDTLNKKNRFYRSHCILVKFIILVLYTSSNWKICTLSTPILIFLVNYFNQVWYCHSMKTKIPMFILVFLCVYGTWSLTWIVLPPMSREWKVYVAALEVRDHFLVIALMQMNTSNQTSFYRFAQTSFEPPLSSSLLNQPPSIKLPVTKFLK